VARGEFCEAVGEGRRGGLERGVRVLAGEDLQGREAGGDGDRVPAEGAGLVDRAERGDRPHDLRAAAVSGAGHAAADDLAEAGEVRGDAVAGLGAAEGDAEAGHDLVEDQDGAVAVHWSRRACR
jgi:hypothetical protein